VDTFEEPTALAQALKKLSVHNLANLTPHPLYVFLHYSHPPMLQRLRAIHGAATRLA
jgi:STE24 endopeptidase